MINNKNFGMDINCSVVYNNGDYEIGINYKDSENRQASSHITTDDLEDAINVGILEILEEILEQDNSVNKEIEELENQILDSEEQIRGLEQKIQELKNQNKIREEKINKINTETFFLY